MSACFVVMRRNCTWDELACFVPPGEAAKKRFRRWAKRGVWERLMQCSQGPDVPRRDYTCARLCNVLVSQ